MPEGIDGMEDVAPREPGILVSLIPVLVLIVLLAAAVTLFQSDSSFGANQIGLLLSAGVGIILALRLGHTWARMESAIVDGIGLAMGAILILLAVGSLIGTWMLSGTVPTMIYYGLQILDPSYFYVATSIICALVALSIGSSWTVAGTIGIALIGVAQGLGLSVEVTAGAIISGAYFGDKMSPLSDTTNLAPAVAGTDLFTHIQHMLWTTVPSLTIALIIFAFIGVNTDSSDSAVSLQSSLQVLEQNFTISLWTLIPLLLVLGMAIRKVPAFPTILIGALVGGVFAVIFQPEVINRFVDSKELKIFVENSAGESSGFVVWLISVAKYVAGVWMALFDGFSASTGDAKIDDLISRGGMSSMLNTVWLIVTAMVFGAVMEKAGFLRVIVGSLMGMVNSTGSLIVTVLLTCMGMNVIAADQYIAIVLPGRMYRAEFKRFGLESKNLSRTLEDAGTITSPLVPWNTCGAYMAGTLGVATLAYLPFCFFNLTNPIVSAIYGITHFKITKIADAEQTAAVN